MINQRNKGPQKLFVCIIKILLGIKEKIEKQTLRHNMDNKKHHLRYKRFVSLYFFQVKVTIKTSNLIIQRGMGFLRSGKLSTSYLSVPGAGWALHCALFHRLASPHWFLFLLEPGHLLPIPLCLQFLLFWYLYFKKQNTPFFS